MRTTRLVFVSDTHGHRDFTVPDGDVLIHCGDGTSSGTPEQVRRWGDWLRALPHRRKLFIAGNHDFLFQRDRAWALRSVHHELSPGAAAFSGVVSTIDGSLTYLEDGEAEVDGVRVYGSPWQPWFHDWAFNLPRGQVIAEKWAMIPSGLDVLVTHGPPRGALDATDVGELVGCADLRQAVDLLRPRVHAFGHIHEQYGTTWNTRQVGSPPTLFVNASTCTLQYRPENPPIVVDLPEDRSLPAEVVAGG